METSILRLTSIFVQKRSVAYTIQKYFLQTWQSKPFKVYVNGDTVGKCRGGHYAGNIEHMVVSRNESKRKKTYSRRKRY
jgi:hypothetical protein